ncbi:MAG TPA: hypothetical protein VKV40_05115 [Ktedonobacteraceae bacterium]|nr:hypothetical protein [Ktedonobacteraceae bacterium]
MAEDPQIEVYFATAYNRFGEGYSTENIKMSWRKDFNNDVAAWDTTICNPADWLDEFVRILKPTGNIFAFTSYNLSGQWHQAFDPDYSLSLPSPHRSLPTFHKTPFTEINTCATGLF